MRLPHVQFTVRWFVALAAVWVIAVGLALTLERRRSAFLRLAAHHQSKVVSLSVSHESALGSDRVCRETWKDQQGHTYVDEAEVQAVIQRNARLNRWHLSLARRYREAAARPWLTVHTEPPEPE